MSWPTPQDYNEALQNPKISFQDPDLQTGTPEVTPLGIPRPITGGFASVYSVRSGSRRWAVRCFLRDFADHQERYAEIGRHISSAGLPYTVGFQFLEHGIRVRGQWYPVLKMEWIEGFTFQQAVEANLQNPLALADLAQRWLKMLGALRKHGIAHGDLQHGNVLVAGGDFRLIDYDGMFVPAFAGKASHEVGHRNYQHPARTENDFGPHLDNFSGWAVYLSLMALSIDSSLWSRYGGGDEHFLFRKEDFDDPRYSRLFRNLQHLKDDRLQKYLPLFRSYLGMTLSSIASPADVIDAPPKKRKPQNVALPGWSREAQLDLFASTAKLGAAVMERSAATATAVAEEPPPHTQISDLAAAVASESGSSSETAMVDAIQFAEPVVAERILLSTYAVFMMMLTGLMARGNLPGVDTVVLLIAGLGCMGVCLAFSYVVSGEVRTKSVQWLVLELRRNRCAVARFGAARLSDWIPRIDLKQSQKLRRLAARDIDYVRDERDHIVEVKRTLASWVDELNARRKELELCENREAAGLLAEQQARYDSLVQEAERLKALPSDKFRPRDLNKLLKSRKRLDVLTAAGPPKILSPAERAAIRKKYDLQRQAIRRSETFARAAARDKVLKIRRTRERRHERLEARRTAVRRRTDRRQERLQRAVDRSCNWLAAEHAKLSRQTIEITAYRDIRFPKYVRRIMGLQALPHLSNQPAGSFERS